MNTRSLREIIGFILAALLLTSILQLGGTTATGQRRRQQHQQRVISGRSIDEFQPAREAQPVRPFHTFGPFGRSYHPFWDPYGRYDHYTFFRRSISRHGHD
jgi:hypothetical protein